MFASLLYRLSDNHPLNEKDDYSWGSPPHTVLLSELKMLLMSRARLPDIEDIPLINTSVLNYGIAESFSKTDDINYQRLVLETRLKNALARFETRLGQVSFTSNTDNPQAISFILRGSYFSTSIALELTWNESTGRFYFDE